MTYAEGQQAVAFWKRRLARLIGLAVWATIAVARNGPIRLVGDGDVHEVLVGLLLLGSAEGFCALESVASRHPASSFLLGEYDGVENRTGGRLNGYDPSCSLVQVVQFHPSLQSLFPETDGHLVRHYVTSATYDQLAVLYFGSILWMGGNSLNRILPTVGEVPVKVGLGPCRSLHPILFAAIKDFVPNGIQYGGQCLRAFGEIFLQSELFGQCL